MLHKCLVNWPLIQFFNTNTAWQLKYNMATQKLCADKNTTGQHIYNMVPQMQHDHTKGRRNIKKTQKK